MAIIPTQRSISARGLAFVKSFESFVAYPYDDLRPPIKGKYAEWTGGPVKGTLTIGYGHTNAARDPLKIVPGLKLTEAQASQVLLNDLGECLEDVNSLVTINLTQGQFDALVSFDFNCGVANLKKLIAPLNKGDYATTRRNFDLYIRSKGRVLAGLQRRRDGEQAMWDARYGDIIVPTDSLDIPKQVDSSSAAPMSQSKIGNGALGVGGTAAGGGGLLIADRLLDKATDKAGDVADQVIDGATTAATHAAMTWPLILGAVLLTIAVLGCGFIWWQRWKLKRDAGV